MLAIKKKAQSKGIVMLGEPVKPDAPFYVHACHFRDTVEKLGLSGAAAVRELVAESLPALDLLSPQELDGAEIRLLVTVEVKMPDGTVRNYRAPAALAVPVPQPLKRGRKAKKA